MMKSLQNVSILMMKYYLPNEVTSSKLFGFSVGIFREYDSTGGQAS